jgi:hypothetical protein
MKARIGLAVIVLAVFVPAVRAQRADQGPTEPNNVRFGDPTATAHSLQGFFYGVVKSVAPSQIICDKTEFGDDVVFKVENKTKFYRDGQPGALSDLKVGDQIWLKIHRNKKTGEMKALRVVSGLFPADGKFK